MGKTEKQIQDRDFWYTFLRPTVDRLFRRSMRRYRLVGRENIPETGQIIFTPNHQNGLLDALAVLSLDSRAKVFVSRADIHRKPRLAAILRWLKIMPINRMRDGVDNVRHNDETIRQALEVLHDGVPFCIMPEGTHRRKHSLLPLQKGVFRIARQMVLLTQSAENSEKQPTYIVPVGLEYGDWDHMWESLTVRVGEPICVDDYLQRHADETEPQQLLGLLRELTARMQELILYVPDDADYEANWATLDAHRPTPWERPTPRLPRRMRILLLILGAPLFAACGILTLPIWLPLWIIRPKIKDVAFRNSAEFVWTWLLMPFSLWLALPLWMYVKEYLYQTRHL